MSKAINKLFTVSRNKRHNGNHPGTFYSQSQFSLMRSAIACYSARHNFAPFGHKIIENGGSFIINLYIGIRAKAAKFLSVKKLFLGISVLSFSVLCFHGLFPFRWNFFFVEVFLNVRLCFSRSFLDLINARPLREKFLAAFRSARALWRRKL